ncbi:MAG: YraN family protein [Tissierellia bacterium]|nr:YraN family protein [Tissierellia bacterium]
MKYFNKKTGDIGEDLALEFLEQKGLYVLERNYRNYVGEIDIVAMDEEYLVFIEVKTRLSDRFGMPNEAVDDRKKRKIYDTSAIYIAEKNCTDLDVRYDIVEVLRENGKFSIHHIVNAFSVDEF